MNSSEQIDKLAEALSTAQGQMGKALKDKENPFFKSSYANLESVWDACREPLAANELGIVQAPSFSDGRLHLTTRLIHSSGQWIESTLSIRPKEDSPHALGSAITYAKRYSLMAMVGVADDEDDDGNAASKSSEKSEKSEQQHQYIDQSAIDRINELLDVGIDVTKFFEYIHKLYGVSDLKKLTKKQSRTIIQMLERKVKYVGVDQADGIMD